MVADTLALVKQERQIRPRIVVVDDEPVILEIIENLIRSWFEDAAVLLFQDGQAAWGELLRTDPDLLITDLKRSGEMDGWRMIPLLAERKVKYPIVLVSGYTKGKDLRSLIPSDSVQDLLQRVRPSLKVSFLAKPFEDEDLRKILATTLNIPIGNHYGG